MHVPPLDLTTSLRGDSVAFGKAPPREAESQPISQSGKQAGRQAGRNTQLSFFQVGGGGGKLQSKGNQVSG